MSSSFRSTLPTTHLRVILSALLFGVQTHTLYAREGGPPATFRDDGACPFECCTYREWSVEVDTPLFAKPDRAARIVGKAQKGTKVQGLTGVVFVTKPGEIEVMRHHTGESQRTYKPGDRVRVYTELGEGFFKVWHKGEMYEEAATFMYQGRGGWDSCVKERSCWGKRKSFPSSVWWVKVRTKNGVVGWSRTPENFGNVDACG